MFSLRFKYFLCHSSLFGETCILCYATSFMWCGGTLRCLYGRYSSKYKTQLQFKKKKATIKQTNKQNTESSWKQVILLFHFVSIVIHKLLEMILCNFLLLLTEKESLVHRVWYRVAFNHKFDPKLKQLVIHVSTCWSLIRSGIDTYGVWIITK